MNKANTTDDQLRAEIEDLRRQLEEQRKLHSAGIGHVKSGPSAGKLVAIAVLLIVILVAGFFAGYLPRQRREQVLAAESKADAETLPTVTVTPVTRGGASTELSLPGTIQPVTEAPVLARASGYIKKRSADIGDRVQAGQILAELEAPELDQQIRQAQATLQQAQSSMEQAQAALEQGRSNEALAKVTADRWKKLVDRGAVSKQENDVYQAQYVAQQANSQALGKAVSAANSNIGAAQANLERLNDLKSYLSVRAPFAGVITVRNVDVGALVTEGSTLLFRIAQTGQMRTFVNVPQSDADSIHTGQAAVLEIPDLPGRKFTGRVSRTSNALDPASRTLLTEVEVPNADGALLPGAYTNVELMVAHAHPLLLVPGDTLVVRSDGPQVAVINAQKQVHFAKIQLGRDYGDHLEVLNGVQEGQQLVVNPSDSVREGVKVNPVPEDNPGKRRRG
ncbi:MAG: efflux RND transporter periplasmic adaptor subunit [Acidobacteriia bacterium]|nr:efflux RND transporter periplasmic adaptor subunit [Terriglobia bacterium]